MPASLRRPRGLEPRPGRARLLLLLPLLALLVGVILLVVAAPAQAQGAPAVVTVLNVVGKDRSISVNWTAPTGTVTGYDVHYTSALASAVANGVAASGSDPATAWVAVSRSGTTATETIPNLTNGTTYRVRVRAKNNDGNSAWVHGTDAARHPIVEFVSITNSADEDGDSIVLSITTVTFSTASSVIIRAGMGGTADASDYSSQPLTVNLPISVSDVVVDITPLLVDDDLNEPAETLVLQLEAIDNAPYKLGSKATSTITILDDDTPAVPTNLMATPGNAQLSLTWTAPTGPVTSYDVHYTTGRIVGSVSFPAVANDAPVQTGPSDTAATGWLAVERSGASAAQTISSLENNLYHRVRVRAKNENGDSSWAFVREAPRNTLVTISASPNPVIEGSHVTVTVTLSKALASADAIPITITNDTAEPTDHGALASQYINLAAGSSSASTGIVTNQDDDQEDETFTVALGTFPTSLTEDGWIAVSPSSVTVTIADDDKPTVTGLTVTPGVGRLDVSWRPPPARLGTVAAYAVHYTSSATVSNVANADMDATDPAAGWVVALSSDDESTTPSYTIAGLAAGTAYRVRVAFYLADLTASGYAHATGTPTAPAAIVLSATPTVDEGSSVTVGVTLAQAPTADVDVPLTLTAGTAETGDYDDSLSSITVSAGQTTGTGKITTAVDTDPDDETFTVAIDRTALSALGYAPGPGDENAKLIQIRDRSELSLEINYGDQKLLVGPNGDLGDPTDTNITRYVQASPTMERLSLKLSWKAGHIASDPTAQVYYYMPGVAGDTLTWNLDTENGMSKTLEMYSHLGTPGYPKVTLSAGGRVEYTIIFQNNVRWEFHHNNLLARLKMILGR